MSGYIISLDQGTTSSRTVLVDKLGNISGISQIEINQYYPKAGWVEEDPKEILRTQIKTLKECLKANRIGIDQITSVGITNQRETTILWNKRSGEPVYNAIVWQCSRGKDLCKKIKSKGYEALIENKTGLVIDPYFSATKISWILDNVEGVRKLAERGEILFGTVDTWLLWNLTDGKSHYTDYSNASRTMLFNINTLNWDEELLDLFNIPKEILPKVIDSMDNFGLLSPKILGREIPVNSLIGDQQSALFGQLCTDSGDVKNTYGTGCFTLMNIGDKPILSDNGLLTTIAWKIGDKCYYALEGSVFVGGAVIQWLRDEMRLIGDASESEILANSVNDCNGVTFVSTFQGLGTPYWNSEVKGEITGITRGSNRAHIVRAALESIAFRSMEIIKTMERDSNSAIREIKVDGGASKNNFLMNFQADILDMTLIRPSNPESTALGAAYLAGLKSGFWKDIDELKSIKKIDRSFAPHMSSDIRHKKIDIWRKAIKKTMT